MSAPDQDAMARMHTVLDAARLLGGPAGQMAAALTEVLHTCHEWNTIAAGEAGAVMYVNDSINQILGAVERGLAAPRHLLPCGCLPNDAGAHRGSCPDFWPSGTPKNWAGQGFTGPAEEPEPDMSPEARARIREALDAADPVRGKGRDLR